ncbi:MAG TPA: histone deacetylase [Geminicoccaceae bacterium]|nr:histone deacetylase [Geminicoccaceae bacterium]
MPLPVVHHPDYVAPMPAGHRFPMGKFGRVMAVLLEDGVVAPAQVVRPEPAPRAWLELAHTPDYVAGVTGQRLDAEAVRRIGLPQSPEVARRALAATGGTVLTARLALEYGVACNTAGGSHHAQAGFGAGFCLFNDVAVAARVLLAEGLVDRLLVVDLDVHQGDGTAAIFRLDPAVFTFSVHCQSNYPLRKQQGDLDVGLDDGLEDDAYLRTLADHLPDLLSEVRPGLVFYNAGVDPHRDDRLGRLMLTSEGLARRDAYVLETCVRAGVPVAGVLGGGYGRDVDEVARRHAILHRVAGDMFGPLRL